MAFWTGAFVMGTRVATRDLRAIDGGPYAGPLLCEACAVAVKVVATSVGDVVAENAEERPRAGRIDQECVRG